MKHSQGVMARNRNTKTCMSYVLHITNRAQCNGAGDELLNSLSLMNPVLPMWNEASHWLVVWLASLNRNWGIPKVHWILGRLQCTVGSLDWWEFLLFYKGHRCKLPACTEEFATDGHLHSPNGRWIACHLELCKETVKQSIWWWVASGWSSHPVLTSDCNPITNILKRLLPCADDVEKITTLGWWHFNLWY